MFETISLIIKYIFVLIVYLFIFGIMRMIYLDIKSVGMKRVNVVGKYPYLKLLNQREYLNFKVEEAYTLDRDLSIGRGGDNNITLGDPFLSKKHARLTTKEGNIYLEDLSSRNGTFLNGRRLEKDESITLTDGDKIKMGNVEFLFMKAN
ncbi:MAG: FHA domain-containing protein [Clostridiaceae bacterium]